jgi:preprotein translocase subunit SecE
MAASRTQEGVALMEEKEKPEKSGGFLDNIRNFWHEVVLEMKKVSWPTQQEVINTTIIVVIAVFFFSIYMFAADLVLTYLIKGIEWAASKVFG